MSDIDRVLGEARGRLRWTVVKLGTLADLKWQIENVKVRIGRTGDWIVSGRVVPPGEVLSAVQAELDRRAAVAIVRSPRAICKCSHARAAHDGGARCIAADCRCEHFVGGAP